MAALVVTETPVTYCKIPAFIAAAVMYVIAAFILACLKLATVCMHPTFGVFFAIGFGFKVRLTRVQKTQVPMSPTDVAEAIGALLVFVTPLSSRKIIAYALLKDITRDRIPAAFLCAPLHSAALSTDSTITVVVAF